VGRVGAITGTGLVLRRQATIASPSWDPSGERLAFTLSRIDDWGPENGNKVMTINADGTCLTRVFIDPEMTVYGTAWQPGPGREAGRIGC
jgi:hypothetical protein